MAERKGITGPLEVFDGVARALGEYQQRPINQQIRDGLAELQEETTGLLENLLSQPLDNSERNQR